MIWTREGAALGYPGGKTSLKEDDVLILFLVVEAMLMPPIRRTSDRSEDRSEMSVWIQVMSAHGEFGQHFLESSARNSGNFGLRAQWA